MVVPSISSVTLLFVFFKSLGPGDRSTFFSIFTIPALLLYSQCLTSVRDEDAVLAFHKPAHSYLSKDQPFLIGGSQPVFLPQ